MESQQNKKSRWFGDQQTVATHCRGLLACGVCILSAMSAHAADAAETKVLNEALGLHWPNQWDSAHILDFTGQISFDSHGGAAFTFDKDNLIVTPGAALIAWLDPGNSLGCSRYALWLQNDEKKHPWYDIFGDDEPAKRNPSGHNVDVTGDDAIPAIEISPADNNSWPGGKPDHLQLDFTNAAHSFVYLARGRGRLSAGTVTFMGASPEILAKGTTDDLVGCESSLQVEGGTAGSVQAGEFHHVHRSVTNTPKNVKCHFLIIPLKGLHE